MTIPRQAASLWHEMSKQIAVHIAEQATNQIPIVGPVAMIILRTALRGQDEMPQQLEEIQEDTKAIRQGPYITGIEYLRQAELLGRSSGDQLEYIRQSISNAAEKFMEAHSQAEDQFSRAVTEYYLATCWILLSNKELASNWFQRAHASALSYLREKEKPAYDAYVTYQQRTASIPQLQATGKQLGGFAVGGAILAVALILYAYATYSLGSTLGSIGPFVKIIVLVAAAIGGAIGSYVGYLFGEIRQSQAENSYNSARKSFEEEAAPPVREFIDALKQLQVNAPDMHLTFPEPLPR